MGGEGWSLQLEVGKASCKRPVPSPAGSSGAGISWARLQCLAGEGGAREGKSSCSLASAAAPEGQPQPGRVLPALMLGL